MIKEDYISFETAKLLKEKGFNESVNRFYEISTGKPLLVRSEYCRNSFTIDYAAPTHQMALKWLREVHKLHIYAKPYWPQSDMRNKMSWQGFIVDLNTINGDSQCYADSYEEAIENRIRFTLENLI